MGIASLLYGGAFLSETNLGDQAQAVDPALVAQVHSVGPVHLDGTNFQSTISRGVTVVDFWATWCGPCRRQLPILDDVAKTLGHEATIAKVNVDQNRQLAQTLGIQSIPSILIFKDGQLVHRYSGVQSADTLVRTVRELSVVSNASRR